MQHVPCGVQYAGYSTHGIQYSTQCMCTIVSSIQTVHVENTCSIQTNKLQHQQVAMCDTDSYCTCCYDVQSRTITGQYIDVM